MNITDIKIRKLIDDGRPLKAIVSITIDDMLAIHDLKVIETAKNTFVAFPSRKYKNSEVFEDIVHPINAAARDYIASQVLAVYNIQRLKVGQAYD